MNEKRIKHNALFHKLRYIKRDIESESVSYHSLHYVQTLFDRIPDDRLREERDNATALDQVEEILANYQLFT